MEAILLSLCACAAFGSADFIGGLKSRSVPLLTVLLISHLAGFLAIGIFFQFFEASFPTGSRILYTIGAGMASITALACLYKAMVVGPISIAAPITASGAVLPVIAGVFAGETPGNLQKIGVALAIVGVILVSMEPGDKTQKIGLGVMLGLIAGICVGAYFILIDAASTHSPIGAAFSMSFSALCMILAFSIFQKPDLHISKSSYVWIALVGVLETSAEALFAVASTLGMLSIVSVVSSLYPAVTVLLAKFLLREQLEKRQWIGVWIAIGSLAFISAG